MNRKSELYNSLDPDFLRCREEIRAAAKNTDNVFFALMAAHEVLIEAFAFIAKNNPDDLEFRKGIADQLRISADWCEFMPIKLMYADLSDTEIYELINNAKMSK